MQFTIRSLILAALVAAFALPGIAQGVSVRNLASKIGVVAPGSLALIEGESFVGVSVTAPNQSNLPFELAGIRVRIAGRSAGIRGAGPDGIVIQAPVAAVKGGWSHPFPLGWQSVEVETPRGAWSGWANIQRVSPGIFTNPNGTVQGVVRYGNEPRVSALSNPIENRATRVMLLCTGLRLASDVAVYVGEDFVTAAVWPFTGFAGLDSVYFDLPAWAHGRLPVKVYSGGRLSNEVEIKVR